MDDAIAAAVGAVGGVAGQFIGDVITSVKEGKPTFSSWQDYVGSAAGGVVSLYGSPIAGGATGAAVGRLTTEGLKKLTDPDYSKSGWDVVKETVIDTALGALGGAVSDLIGKGVKAVLNTKFFQNVTGKLMNGGKVGSWLGNLLFNASTGKSGRWGQWTNFLKKQHENIARSPALKKKLIESLFKRTVPLLFSKVLETLTGKLKPLSDLAAWAKEKLSEYMKGVMLSTASTDCAGQSAA